MDDIRVTVDTRSQRFTPQFRLCIRQRGLAYATEKTYLHWVVRFIRFHGNRHPASMAEPEVEAFLTDLMAAARFICRMRWQESTPTRHLL